MCIRDSIQGAANSTKCLLIHRLKIHRTFMILDFLMPKNQDSERISGIDTAWLRMERPTNLMMITGVMIFAERLAYERLREVVESRFLKYRRFAQRAVQKTAGAVWAPAPYFAPNRHESRTGVPGRADKAELQHLASDLMLSLIHI